MKVGLSISSNRQANIFIFQLSKCSKKAQKLNGRSRTYAEKESVMRSIRNNRNI